MPAFDIPATLNGRTIAETVIETSDYGRYTETLHLTFKDGSSVSIRTNAARGADSWFEIVGAS